MNQLNKFFLVFLSVTFLCGKAFSAELCEKIVYRAYQSNATDHLFTISENEAFNLSRAWRMEGLAFFACDSSGQGLNEIKRYYSQDHKDHYYAIAGQGVPSGYRLEGTAFYIAEKEEPCLLPLYVAQRTGNSDTVLAFNPSEVKSLHNDSAWTLKSIIGWVRPYGDIETKMLADQCRKTGLSIQRRVFTPQ